MGESWLWDINFIAYWFGPGESEGEGAAIQSNWLAYLNKKLLGKTIEVLIDEKQKGVYLGRSQNDAPEVDGLVYVKSKRLLREGEFVNLKVTDTLEYDLIGEVL